MTPHARKTRTGLRLWAAIVFVLARPAVAQELAQARLAAEPPFPVIDPAYAQTRLEEQNDRYDVFLLVSNADRSLQCAVLDGSRSVVWRGRALSPTVVLAPDQPRLAFIGQREREGFYPVDVMPEPGDIIVQDLTGSVLFRITGTGPVARAQFSRQGLLGFLTTGEVRVYGPAGNLLWRKPGQFSDLRFWDDGGTVSVWAPEMRSGFNRTAILDSRSGALRHELRYRPGQMRVLEVRSAGGEAVVAESRGASRWDVVLYGLDRWDVKGRLSGLEASPLSAAWGGKEYAVLLWAPDARAGVRAGETLVGVWKPGGDSFTVQSLGVSGGSPARDRVTYDGAGGRYRVRVGARVAEFLSSK